MNPISALKVLFGPEPRPLVRPVVLQFPVVDICNSKCQMCHIWKHESDDSMSPEQIRRALADPLFQRVTDVGVNGGEPTLRSDLGEVVSAMFDSLPSLKNVSLITNALNHKQVIKRIDDIRAVIDARGGHLDVMVSLDGVREVHDTVRGRPGNFAQAEKVLDHLQGLGDGTTVRVGCTIIRDNARDLLALLDYCSRRGVDVKYRLGIPHQRLDTANVREPFALDDGERYAVVEFLEGLLDHYERSPRQRLQYRSLIGQLARDEPRRAGCMWQHEGATISAEGELMYCAVKSPVLGSILAGDAERTYFAGRNILAEIVAKDCSTCAHDYTGRPTRRQLPILLRDRISAHPGAVAFVRQLYRATGARRILGPKRYGDRRDRLATAAAAVTASGRYAGWVSPDEPSILLCGWYGTETLGDQAILGGILTAMRRAAPRARIGLASLNPYVSRATRMEMGHSEADYDIIPMGDAAAYATRSRLVAFAGGPVMGIDSLAEIEVVFDAAKAAGRPIAMLGVGVGPWSDPWHRRSIARLLAAADARIYRDRRSLELAGSLGVDTAADAVADDPSFTWLAAGNEDDGPMRPNDGRRTLLLALRELPHQQYASHLGTAAYARLKDRMEHDIASGLRRALTRHSGLVVKPLPMCTNHFGGDDRWYLRELFARHPLPAEALDLSLIHHPADPAGMRRAFREADAAIAMRFHSLVFALSQGTPVLALDYTFGHGKVASLASSSGVPHLQPDGVTADAIERYVGDLLAAKRRDPIRPETSFSRAVEPVLRGYLQVPGGSARQSAD